MARRVPVIFGLALSLLASRPLSGQATPAAPAPTVPSTAPVASPSANTVPERVETAQELASRLTPLQRQQFDEANKAFQAQKYSDALAAYKQLLAVIPGDTYLSKVATESALNTGADAYAHDLIKPVVMANLEDWQAVALMVRASAQSGDKAGRDAAMLHMASLHQHGITPAAMRQYAVEQVEVGNGSVLIFQSLEPWSQYHIQNYCKIAGADGSLLLTLTLENDDFDQPGFAKQHPKEAAAGLRRFSLDGYSASVAGADGKRTQTHYTFKFFVGLPDYDTVRKEFLEVAVGHTKAISSRDGIPVS